MGKKRRILFLAVMFGAVGIMAWVLFRPGVPEPVYQGKPLGFWLEGYDAGNYRLAHPKGPHAPERQEADRAIRDVGEKAVPYLLEKLQRHDSKTKMAMRRFFRQHQLSMLARLPINEDFKAFQGFKALGAAGSNAVPQLVRIFEHDRTAFPQQVVPAILAAIGPPAASAVPILLSRGVTHTNDVVRNNALYALRKIHPGAKSVVPVMVKYLDDPSALVREQAALGLADYGSEAREALPRLLQLYREESYSRMQISFDGGDGAFVGKEWTPLNFRPDLKLTAARSIRYIDPEVAKNKDGPASVANKPRPAGQ